MHSSLKYAAGMAAALCLLLGQARPAAAQTVTLAFKANLKAGSTNSFGLADGAEVTGELSYDTSVPGTTTGTTGQLQYLTGAVKLKIGASTFSDHGDPLKPAWMRVTHDPTASPAKNQVYAFDDLNFGGATKKVKISLASTSATALTDNSLPLGLEFSLFDNQRSLKIIDDATGRLDLDATLSNVSTPAPEPATAVLMLPSLAVLGALRRRKKSDA